MAKRKYTPGPTRIANKLKSLLKAKIKEYDLIDTKLMYDSIWVEPDGEYGFIIHAEHYFKFLDEGTVYIPAYNIVENTINSKEFQDYVADTILQEIVYQIEDI